MLHCIYTVFFTFKLNMHCGPLNILTEAYLNVTNCDLRQPLCYRSDKPLYPIILSF